MNIERQNLSYPQIEFLKFLGNRQVSETELEDIKRLVALYYLRKADEEMDRIWEEKGLTVKDMDQILEQVL